MKWPLTLLLVLISIFTTKASHLAGGEIWYEYIGDSSNPYRYKVYLNLYRDYTGQAVTLCTGPCTRTLCLSSSCYSNKTFQVSLQQFSLTMGSDTLVGSNPYSIQVPELNECIDSTAQRKVEMYRFEGTVDLQGPCTDYKFNYSECCRNSQGNFQNSAASDLSIQCSLNNMSGENSSPAFTGPGTKTFCMGKIQSLPILVKDPDNDSLFYRLEQPLDFTTFNNCPSSIAYLANKAGFDKKDFMTTTSGVHVDSINGILMFTPTTVQNVGYRIDIEEYRYDSTLQANVFVGTSSRDIQVSIVATCANDSNRSWIGVANDSLGMASLISCGDSIIEVTSAKTFFASTLASDGSDFALYNSLGTPIAIKSAKAKPYGQQSKMVKSFVLELIDPINYNDTLRLVTRTGTDSNSLVSQCHDELPVQDTIFIAVKACTTSIGLTPPNATSELRIYPNPTSGKAQLPITNVNPLIIRLFDLSGKELQLPIETHRSNDVIELNFSELEKGMYLLQITSEDEIRTINVLKR